MEFSGIRRADVVHSDSDSTDVEHKLSQMPTESSSDNNEDCIPDSLSSEHAIVQQAEAIIHERGVRVPVEHDETESKSAIIFESERVKAKA